MEVLSDQEEMKVFDSYLFAKWRGKLKISTADRLHSLAEIFKDKNKTHSIKKYIFKIQIIDETDKL